MLLTLKILILLPLICGFFLISGVLVTNMAARDEDMKLDALGSLQRVFCSLVCIPLQEDINDIVVGMKGCPNRSAVGVCGNQFCSNSSGIHGPLVGEGGATSSNGTLTEGSVTEGVTTVAEGVGALEIESTEGKKTIEAKQQGEEGFRTNKIDSAKGKEGFMTNKIDSAKGKEGFMTNEIDSAEGKDGFVANEIDSAEGKDGFMANEIDSAEGKEGFMANEIDSAKGKEGFMTNEIDSAKGKEVVGAMDIDLTEGKEPPSDSVAADSVQMWRSSGVCDSHEVKERLQYLLSVISDNGADVEGLEAELTGLMMYKTL